MKKEAIIIHNPHSSTMIPQIYRLQFLLTDAELNEERLRITDRYIDELFCIPGIQIHQNSVSRLLMDPERFRSDEDESMSQKGMGLAYTHTSLGKVMRELSASEKDHILTELYDPYHAELTRKVDEIVDNMGKCLIIDAHSFPSVPLPYEDKQQQKRPDICLGYEIYHLDPHILQMAEHFFKDNQLTVAKNTPFAGSIVPAKHYHKDSRVQSLMIEINRALYMDEQNGGKLGSFDVIRKLIQGFFTCL